MADVIARKENISGELFDLSVPSLNNGFGWKHITGIMRYGISFPLEKFMDELQDILKPDDAPNAPPDDKTPKRRARLRFLYHCFESIEVQDLFPLFCNYINGGGNRYNDDGEIVRNDQYGTWIDEQYDLNYMIITVAGGNIITLFAQLLVNMIDSFTKATNAEFDAPDFEYEDWDIHANWYSPETFDNGEASDTRDSMFHESFSTWSELNWRIINQTYRLLTDTNKILLKALEKNSQFSKEQIAFLIVSHFLHNDHDGSVEKDVRFVARAPYSDFDFKLSPNIDLDLLKGIGYDVEPFIHELDEAVKKEAESSKPPPAGFLLLRAKSLIVCNTRGRLPGYTSKQLKSYQRDCSRKLGPWVYSLFPQTMQKEYLDMVEKDSDCYKFLSHLMGKKLMIGDATRNNVDEILKFYLSGYYKPINRRGHLYAVVPESPNSTEAIINYLRNTTYHLNVYIDHWESIDEDGIHKLSPDSAPALHNGGLAWYWDKVTKKYIEYISYRSVCFGFLNLNNILYQNYGLISRLASDILNYFLNDTPLFHTETILDKLIESVNNKKYETTGRNDDCFMPPSDLVLVPTNAAFNPALKNLKDIFNISRYSELGYPDGVRITINAIESGSRIPDTRLDDEEYRVQKIAEYNSNLQTEYLPLPTRAESTARSSTQGGYKKKHTKKKHTKKKHTKKKDTKKKHSKKKHSKKKHTKKKHIKNKK